MSSDVSRRRARLRSGLRRHGLVRRPEVVTALVRSRRLRFTEGNRVELLHTGRIGLESMLEALSGAKERIHLETYILRSDATGRRFAAALEERARNGVQVRVLYDALGSRGLDPSVFEALEAAGGEIFPFNPITRIYPRFAPRRRDHRKILAVDGRVAFVGGLNIGDEYIEGIGPGPGGEWRDAHVRVEGPAVRDLEAVFLESWFRADGPALDWSTLLAPEPPEAGPTRCAILADGPAYRRRRMRDLIVSALDAARGEVLLASPYFAPGVRVLDALSRASQRGVRVELLLAGHSDHPILRRAARSIVPRILRAGVRVSEYHRAMMHAKVAVFDGEWGLVGTSNLDRQSFEHSYEVNLIVEGEEAAGLLARQVRKDLADAEALDAEALARRGPIERTVDRLAALVLYFA